MHENAIHFTFHGLFNFYNDSQISSYLLPTAIDNLKQFKHYHKKSMLSMLNNRKTILCKSKKLNDVISYMD